MALINILLPITYVAASFFTIFYHLFPVLRSVCISYMVYRLVKLSKFQSMDLSVQVLKSLHRNGGQ